MKLKEIFILKVLSVKVDLGTKAITKIKMHSDFTNQGPTFKGIIEVAINDLKKDLVILKSGSAKKEDYNTYNVDVLLIKKPSDDPNKNRFCIDYKNCYKLEKLTKKDQKEITQLIIGELQVNKVMMLH